MQSLHPLPHTNPFDGTTEKAGAHRKDIILSKQKYCLPAPHSSLRVRGPCGAEGRLEGQDEGLHTLLGTAVTVGEGERGQISAQNFQQRTAQVRKWK